MPVHNNRDADSYRTELSRVDLELSRPLRRDRPRPPEARGPDYDDVFDFLTVFYDCFRSADGRSIVFVGPPLLNLSEEVLPVLEKSLGRSWFARMQHRPLDRVSEVWARSRAACVPLPGGAFVQSAIDVQPNGAETFRGARALVTISKDNDLAWIRDWAFFHARNHGCNAILLYDNNSTRYEPAELRALLTSVAGIEAALVVTWPYKFGAVGSSSEPWDSDFAPYGMFEHARHRFLATADAVLNAEIDELVVTRDGSSVFDLVRKSRGGYSRAGIGSDKSPPVTDGSGFVVKQGASRRRRDEQHPRKPASRAPALRRRQLRRPVPHAGSVAFSILY